MNKRKSKIVLQLGMCLLCLVVMIMSTLSYAWFVQNKDATTDPMQMGLKAPDDIIVSTTVHSCIGLDNNGVRYFNKEAAATNDLKKYMFLVENNRQLLLHIRLEEPEAVEGISLRAATDTTYFLGDGQHPLHASSDGRGEEYDNVLSSIIAFYVVNPEDATYDSKEAYRVTSFGTSYSFINKNDYSMTNVLTLVNRQTVKDIYVVLDYNPDLVSKVFMENLGNILLERTDGSFLDEVFYVWDINLEVTQK